MPRSGSKLTVDRKGVFPLALVIHRTAVGPRRPGFVLPRQGKSWMPLLFRSLGSGTRNRVTEDPLQLAVENSSVNEHCPISPHRALVRRRSRTYISSGMAKDSSRKPGSSL